MRHSFVYSVLHLSTLTFFTAATPPRWNIQAPQRNTCLPFDLNISAAEATPPERISSSDDPPESICSSDDPPESILSPNEQIASSPAMDMFINPGRYTPEGLAANILLFPGSRGPKASAGMQSASSHGRDHRGYPLWQQSSSSRFSSTSPGKRKTRDSSAGSTSRRYKKVGTDRYEPYKINQHFPLKNSVSDMIPTSLKPGYVLATGKRPTREASGKIKVEQSSVFTGLETKKKEPTLFNMYDWNFLREFPEREQPNDRQHQYLRYLNRCKGASDVESFFFLQRDRANEFMNNFVSRTSQREFDFPLNSRKRPEILFKTLLRLSDQKINLDSYSFFQNGIIDSMSRRISRNVQATGRQSGHKEKTVITFVRDVTKVTQLLIVAHLSLFKEHESEGLTVHEVEKHLRFFQELWFQIDQGTPEMQKKEWAMTAHHVLHFQAYEHSVHSLGVRRSTMYNFCWDVVNHWREKTGNDMTGFHGQQKFKKLKEMVEKMIFFSNNHISHS